MADHIVTDNQISDTDLKLDKLARDVLNLSRNTLIVNLRFMDEALSRLTPAAREGSLSTDGEHLFYDARFVLRRYMSERELPVRDYLHTAVSSTHLDVYKRQASPSVISALHVVCLRRFICVQ